jgi:hypothetical protein
MAWILPPGASPAGTLLRAATGAPPLLTAVRSVDEGLVIAAALALSSSAFVLQVRAPRAAGRAPPWVLGSIRRGGRSALGLVPLLALLTRSPCATPAPPPQLLSERGETATRAGSATLGVLLMQVGRRAGPPTGSPAAGRPPSSGLTQGAPEHMPFLRSLTPAATPQPTLNTHLPCRTSPSCRCWCCSP